MESEGGGVVQRPLHGWLEKLSHSLLEKRSVLRAVVLWEEECGTNYECLWRAQCGSRKTAHETTKT
jgi:hypothetical protein